MARKLTREEFIRKAKEVHKGENLDYSKVVYINNRTPVIIIDHDLRNDGTEYGEYTQRPSNHLNGKGHPDKGLLKNKTSRTMALSEFIQRAEEIHKGENLDYSKAVYINNHTPLLIIDHDLKEDGTEYGEFWQSPSNHLKGQSHPEKRGLRISQKKTITQEEYIERAKHVHASENIDYSGLKYNGMHKMITVYYRDLDPNGNEYGEFTVEAGAFLKGVSHPKKSKDRRSVEQTSSLIRFIREAEFVHANKGYTYEAVNYKNNRTPVRVNCHCKYSNGKEHGYFYTMPTNFLRGKGCPICGNVTSHAENEIASFISELIGEDKVIKRNKTILDANKELDIYIPSYNLAIEYDGLRRHSDEFGKDRNYHISKTLECKNKGISLIHVFEDEWNNNKQIVLDKIRHILGVEHKAVIGARKCTIREISFVQARDFLEKYHIQGSVNGSVYIGAEYNNELVGVAVFLVEHSIGKWDLVRFATKNDSSFPGLASKIFKYFITKYEPREIKSFLDRRWCVREDSNLYTKLGFKFDGYVPPDYRYTDGVERYHKFNFRKQILCRKYPEVVNMSMTETEMTDKLGWHKIYDCGLIRYVWKKDSNSE